MESPIKTPSDSSHPLSETEVSPCTAVPTEGKPSSDPSLHLPPPPGLLDPARRRIWTPVARDWAVFEKYGRETGGAYTELRVGVAPGGRNAKHWHGSYSETFTALRGRVGVYTPASGEQLLTPGESVTVPAGTVHYFFHPTAGDDYVEKGKRTGRKAVGGGDGGGVGYEDEEGDKDDLGEDEEVEMRIRLQPACEGFEKGLYIIYGLARDGKSANGGIPNSLMHSAVVFTMSDMWPTGLGSGIIIPVMKVIAFVGRIVGVEDRLVKQYWT